MDNTNEKLFFDSLEQFTVEYKNEILQTLKKTDKQYNKLRENFGEAFDKLEKLADTMDKQSKEIIDIFTESYFILVNMEFSQIYLQGQVDGMRIMKRLYGDKIY